MYKRAGGLLRADLFTAGGQHVEPEVVRGQTALPALTPEVGMLVDALEAAECIPVDLDSIAGFDVTTVPDAPRHLDGLRGPRERRWSGRAGLPLELRHQPLSVVRRARRPTSGTLPWHERLSAVVDWAALAGRLGPASDRGAEDEAWRAIWQTDLGYPIRTLPERPEVTILWGEPAGSRRGHSASSSPEPLFATDRTVLALRRKRVRIVLTPMGPRTDRQLARGDPPARPLGRRRRARCSSPWTRLDQPVALAPGQYRLEATYRLTGVLGLPELSRQGDTTDETATWPFVVPATPDPDRGPGGLTMADQLLQDPRLTLTGAGFLGDPEAQDGIHLRWSFDPDLGFPSDGFRLCVPARPCARTCARSRSRGSRSSSRSQPAPAGVADGVTVHRADGGRLEAGRRCDQSGLELGSIPLVLRFRPSFGAPPGTVRRVTVFGLAERGGGVGTRASCRSRRRLRGERAGACLRQIIDGRVADDLTSTG